MKIKSISLALAFYCIISSLCLVGCGKKSNQDNSLSTSKASACESINTYYEQNKDNVSTDLQIEMLKEMTVIKEKINNSENEEIINKLEQKGKYCLDLIVLKEQYNKNVLAIEDKYIDDIYFCMKILEELSESDMYLGSEREYEEERNECRNTLIQLDIKYDQQVNAKLEWCRIHGVNPTSYLSELERNYKNSRVPYEDKIELLDEQWNKRKEYEEVSEIYDLLNENMEIDLLEEEFNYKNLKLEIELKIAELQID